KKEENFGIDEDYRIKFLNEKLELWKQNNIWEVRAKDLEKFNEIAPSIVNELKFYRAPIFSTEWINNENHEISKIAKEYNISLNDLGWLIGLWLGDGYYDSTRICINMVASENEILD